MSEKEEAMKEAAGAAQGDKGVRSAPTPEQLRKEFAEMLVKPIDEAERGDAEKQALMCDIHIAELRQAAAALRAQIAATEVEIAKSEFAKSIICRRLANRA